MYVELSFEWIKHSGLKAGTEGFITATQHQEPHTRYYSKQGATKRYRMCHTQQETVEHIISGCQTLATYKYLIRHNEVVAKVHLDMCKQYGIKVDLKHWYEHNPE